MKYDAKTDQWLIWDDRAQFWIPLYTPFIEDALVEVRKFMLGLPMSIVPKHKMGIE